ncbi:infB [Symbiodinium natans]|uniref:InfB protein n=1 Tax=Symbiodinium natans TaxID=878477 RepID=A0A812KBM9_9DINO|nr:infB [Symbiodinium natans]
MANMNDNIFTDNTRASASQVALVVISVERGAELQTEEVLMHASRWKVPVVFALNKIDLPDSHLELTRAELRRQCQLLHEHGLVDVDWTKEAEEAIPISALYRQNLEALVAKVQAAADALPQLPLRPAQPLTITPGEAQQSRNVQRRTDFLVGVEAPPTAVALILEVSKPGEEQGEMMLTALVRAGRLVVGQFFVAGTAFGRITNLSVATGLERNRLWLKCDHAGVGVAVQLTGLRTRKVGGDCAVDDLLFALPRERAWRLCEHRQRIEQLMACQVFGPPLEVAWENDAQIQSRTQAAFEREAVDYPEKHAGSAYDRRWDQPAVEEVSGLGPAFSNDTRRDFQAPFTPESSAEHAERAPREAAPPRLASRFQVLQPSADAEAAGADGSRTDAPRHGRRSRQRVGSGAWSADPETVQPERDFVYYVDRKSWDEESEIDTKRVQARWQGRDKDRWEEERRKEKMRQDEQQMAERIRREAFGEVQAQSEEEEDVDVEEHEPGDDEGPVVPLPRRKVQVIPIILKTKSVSQFDMLMEEIDNVQETYGVRIVIVHGGLGPVIPKDIVHAEVEKRYGYCPIYAFQVGANPSAVGQADAEQIDIRRFDVFTELIGDLVERCERISEKRSLQRYAVALRHETPSS